MYEVYSVIADEIGTINLEAVFDSKEEAIAYTEEMERTYKGMDFFLADEDEF